jgi:hypothetical protein
MALQRRNTRSTCYRGSGHVNYVWSPEDGHEALSSTEGFGRAWCPMWGRLLFQFGAAWRGSSEAFLGCPEVRLLGVVGQHVTA